MTKLRLRIPGVKCFIAFYAAFFGVPPPTASPPSALAYVAGSTQKVCQLTGDFDRALGQPPLSQTGQRWGVMGTDLGSSFEHRGNLCFLFGDTWGRSRRARSSSIPGGIMATGSSYAANFQANLSATVNDPQRENEWGGEYGSYIIARFTTGNRE